MERKRYIKKAKLDLKNSVNKEITSSSFSISKSLNPESNIQSFQPLLNNTLSTGSYLSEEILSINNLKMTKPEFKSSPVTNVNLKMNKIERKKSIDFSQSQKNLEIINRNHRKKESNISSADSTPHLYTDYQERLRNILLLNASSSSNSSLD